MFVKRINKIYAPTKLDPNCTRNHFSKSTKKKQQPRQQQLNTDQYFQPLKVFTIVCDPHGALIALYSEQSDAIYVVSILTLLEYIDKYRSQFAHDGHYSFKSALKPELIIQNPRPSLNVFQIKFSHCIQNTQFISVVYYNGVIDVYSVVTGKKMDGLDINEKSLQLGQQISPLYNVNIIGHSIFISTYDGKLMCYQGHQLTKCTKYEDQWVRLGYTHFPKVFSEDSQKQEENQALQTAEQPMTEKKQPLYFDKNNNLKVGNNPVKSTYIKKIIKKREAQLKIQSYIKQKQKQKKILPQQLLSQSYNQYLKLQTQKIPIQGDNKPYSLTLCERYIVYNMPINLVYNQQFITSGYYLIRSKQQNWRFAKDIIFPTFPHINHFWGLQINRKYESQRKHISKKNQQLFVSFCRKSRWIIVAVMGNYDVQQGRDKLSYTQGSINEKIITILKITVKKFVFYAEVVCKLNGIKHKVLQIHWIGPNMLLYTDQCGDVYYMQISPQVLVG